MSAHKFPFEKVAKLDSAQRKATQPAAPLVQLIVAQQPERVLELGVGTGYFALPLAQALPAAEVVGLDVEPRMLELTRERALAAGVADRLRLVQTTTGRLEVESGRFDLALLANLYHELPHRPAHLAELWRVLRPGGQLVICDWAPTTGAEPEAGPPNDHRVPLQAALDELARAGFERPAQHGLYDNFYTLLATRPAA